MNKDNARDYLPLVQALAEGKTIQKFSAGDGWEDVRSPSFENPAKLYRIKPEPKKGWYRNYVCKNGGVEVINKLTLNEQEKAEAIWPQKSFQFSHWLTDRIEYTLPEGDA